LQQSHKTLGWKKKDGSFDDEKAKAWNDQVERLFNLFANSKKFDVSGKSNFNSFTRLALKTALLNGEVLALPHWNQQKNAMFNTQLQLVECDRLKTPAKHENNDLIKSGIKLDKNSKPVAYYISKTYPNDSFFDDLSFNVIPAETSFGRKRVIHIFKPDRVDQIRGKPIFTPILTQFKKLDMYEEAELSAAVVSAMIALIVETPNKTDQELMQQFGLETEEEVAEIRAGWDRSMKSGNILHLFNGETAKTFSPNRPNSAFSAFVDHIVRNICVATGLPAEMVMKDFSKCNYSSARAALQEGWEKVLTIRNWFVDECVKEVYCLFLEECANKNLIEAPDFYKYKEAYLKFSVHGPTRGILDPVKEAKAATERINNGTTTRQIECAAMGTNWDDIADQLEKEQEQIKEKGLKFFDNASSIENSKEEEEDEN